MKQLLLTALLCAYTIHAHTQDGVLGVDSIFFHEDAAKGMILINQYTEVLNAQFSEDITAVEIGDDVYTFEQETPEIKIGVDYQVSDSDGKAYTLWFTELPIIRISTANTIVDEPRVHAMFSLCDSAGEYVQNDIGIEYKGNWTQTLPKKSLRIEFWEDSTGEDTENFSLLGMRSDDDWNIQAMFNEPLKLRNKTNFELWRKMNALYYLQDEPEAVNGIKQEYVELFLNNEYMGVYALSERVDRKQLKLKKYKNDEIRGELYKGDGWGASTYKFLKDYNNNSELWSGFEYEHPDEEINWANIYNFVDFVINADSADFYDTYSEKFSLDNAVDYFIFLNLLRATDNTGKNLFVAKYNTDEPYFFVPWDLDGTFGMIWNGTQEDITNDILTNGFYDRLIKDRREDGFADKLKSRWNSLKSGLLSADSLLFAYRTHFNYLKSNGVYDREQMVWNSPFYDMNNLDYTASWLDRRWAYLDRVFNDLDLISSTRDFSLASVQMTVYPNPANDFIYFDCEQPVKNISLVDKLGRTQLRKVINAKTGNIVVSQLRAGAYYMIFEWNDGSIQAEKVIVN